MSRTKTILIVEERIVERSNCFAAEQMDVLNRTKFVDPRMAVKLIGYLKTNKIFCRGLTVELIDG
jgi:hypothetical protein